MTHIYACFTMGRYVSWKCPGREPTNKVTNGSVPFLWLRNMFFLRGELNRSINWVAVGGRIFSVAKYQSGQ